MTYLIKIRKNTKLSMKNKTKLTKEIENKLRPNWCASFFNGERLWSISITFNISYSKRFKLIQESSRKHNLVFLHALITWKTWRKYNILLKLLISEYISQSTSEVAWGSLESSIKFFMIQFMTFIMLICWHLWQSRPCWAERFRKMISRNALKLVMEIKFEFFDFLNK